MSSPSAARSPYVLAGVVGGGDRGLPVTSVWLALKLVSVLTASPPNSQLARGPRTSNPGCSPDKGDPKLYHLRLQVLRSRTSRTFNKRVYGVKGF